MTARDRLEIDLETALAHYLGDPNLGNEWSSVVRAFADTIEKSQVGQEEGYWAARDGARNLTAALGELSNAIASVVD